MSTLSQFLGGGGGEGPRNAMKMWNSFGTFTWVVPSELDATVLARVYVWGAGGAAGTQNTAGNGFGGGGGGLAISELSLTAGDSITVTVGEGSRSYNGRGGTSSFGTHLSATGGNSGFDLTDNEGLAVAGAGGLGLSGNIANRRGGTGGNGTLVAASGGGGGGGSAPHPDGDRDGFKGGNGRSYCGGSGGSICFPGGLAKTNYCSVGGAGTAGLGQTSSQTAVTRSMGGQGGAGLLGSGGAGASVTCYSNSGNGTSSAESGNGGAIWTPNLIFLGGGGGGGGCATTHSSLYVQANAGSGGPGAGGGSNFSYAANATNAYTCAGNGGVLGGGGGSGQYGVGGNGGNAGGAGASGYNLQPTANYDQGIGGDGLIFIQYAIKF